MYAVDYDTAIDKATKLAIANNTTAYVLFCNQDDVYVIVDHRDDVGDKSTIALVDPDGHIYPF